MGTFLLIWIFIFKWLWFIYFLFNFIYWLLTIWWCLLLVSFYLDLASWYIIISISISLNRRELFLRFFLGLSHYFLRRNLRRNASLRVWSTCKSIRFLLFSHFIGSWILLRSKLPSIINYHILVLWYLQFQHIFTNWLLLWSHFAWLPLFHEIPFWLLLYDGLLLLIHQSTWFSKYL